MTRLRPLELDAAAIERLLPHRDPMRLVDRITGFALHPQPRLRAELHLRGDEAPLGGHFPGEPIWPGALLIEGLAQAGGLLVGISALVSENGEAALGQLEGSSALPGRPPSGWLVRVAVDLVALVRPPATIVYEARRAGEHASLIRIDARASVAERSVAQGMITLAIGAQT